jgi:hypothetical protein
MKHSLVPCFVLAVLVGCGGGDDGSTPNSTGATCTQTSPCGGDITGDWSIVSFCPDTSNAAPEEVKQICAQATVDFDTPMVSGTISFKADKSFTQSSSASGTGYLVFPPSCLDQPGAKLTCAQVQDGLTQNSNNQKWACTSANGGCRCGLQLADTANNGGTYTTSSNDLTLTSTGASALPSMYCVKSDKLYMHLSLATTATSGDKPYQVAGQLELEKK